MNKVVAEPQLKDLLDQHKKDILLNTNCHHIGIVQSFDPSKQTANVTIAYKKTFYVQKSVGGPYEKTLKDYPILAEIPVVFLGGGPVTQTFPIKQGDECMVLFNDRDIDTWFSGGINAELSTSRLHSLSDGVALVGIRSLANSIQGFDMDRWLVKDKEGGARIGVGGSKVLVANDIETLNVIVSSLISVIQGMTLNVGVDTNTGIGTAVLNQAAVDGLQAVKNRFAGLLE